MKIKTAKGNLILSIALLLMVITSLLFFFFVYDNELSVYEKLYEHCTEETKGVKKCYVFLSDFREETERTCLDLVLPVFEVSERDIEICVEDKIQWDNPYEDYSVVIPVVMDVYYKKALFKPDVPQRIEMELMSDKKVYELLDKVTDNGNVRSEEPIFPKLSTYGEISTRGYLYYPYKRYGQGDEYLLWSLAKVNFESIDKQGDETTFQIAFQMEGTEYNHTFKADEIRFFDSEDSQLIDLKPDDQPADFINPIDNYMVAFAIYDTETDEIIDAYYDGLEKDIENYFKEDVDSNIYLILEKIEQ